MNAPHPLKEYFTNKEWIIFSIIILLGIVLRWYGLDARPFHHDEALHAMYGKYNYINPIELYYRYDPLLHGPLLYNILPYIYQIFGTNKISARLLPCIIGTIFIFLPLLFNKFLKKNACLLLTALIALSPSLIYWSRFLRHDSLVHLFMLVMLAGVCFAPYRFKSLFVIIGLTLQFCTKENAYITVTLLSVWLIFEYFFNLTFTKNRSSLLSKILKNIKRHPWMFLGALGCGVFIYIGIYSSGFRYWEGILDGLYRKSILYWLNQHNIERIKGPFLFHILFLSWYELLFVLAVVVQTIHFYIKNSWRYLPFLFSAIFVSIFCHFLFYNANLELHPIWGNLKLKIPLDFYPLFMIPVHAIIITISHMKNKQQSAGFWGYLFFATLFTYSYAGEKVPWLSQYAFIAGLVYLALYFGLHQGLLQITLPKTKIPITHALLVVIIIFNLRIAIMTNFSRAGKETEFISQVHTTEIYERIALTIRKEILIPIKGHRPTVYAGSNNTWPLTWYFWGMGEFYYHRGGKNIEDFDYVFTRFKDHKTNRLMYKTHRRIQIPLRAWWVPDYKKINWTNFLNYSISHNPWNPPGRENISLFINKLWALEKPATF